MPKVGTETYTAAGAEGQIRVEITINFSKSKGFTASLPADLVKHMPGAAHISGNSYEDCKAKALAACDKFYSAAIQQKKVILYHFKRNGMNAWRGRNARPDQIDHYTPSYHDDEMLTTGWLGFCVRWMVTVGEKQYVAQREITNASQLANQRIASKYHWSDRGGYSHGEWMGWEFMGHTPELEAWFKKTVDAFEQLLYNIEAFFGKNSTALLENLEASDFKYLLPGSPIPADQQHQP